MLSDNETKLKINNMKITGKSPKLNSKLLNNIWIKEEISREILKYFKLRLLKKIPEE